MDFISKSKFFHKFSQNTSELVGNPITFFVAVMFIVVWATFGPFVKYSDTWQLIINTSTTIITFLIVFLIQNTQNRETKDIILKLDELIRAHKLARNSIIDLEKLSDKQIKELEEQFRKISKDKD